jgi:hypothetical protein
LATGANAEGRLHVVYKNGTEVYVSRPAAQSSLQSSHQAGLRAAGRATAGMWTVMDASHKLHELPVSGWLVFNAHNHFSEQTGIIGGYRFDYVQSLAYDFLDGRGQWTEFGNLGATGSVALRHLDDGLLELIDIYGNDRIAFRATKAMSVMAYDPQGKCLGKVEFTSPQPGWYEFKPLAGGRRYVCAVVPSSVVSSQLSVVGSQLSVVGSQ